MTDEKKPWAGLTEGRIVHVRSTEASHCQAAIVVRAWREFPGEHDNGGANLLVFPDGSNDGAFPSTNNMGIRTDTFSPQWLTSVPHEESNIFKTTREHYPAAKSWHYPERVDD